MEAVERYDHAGCTISLYQDEEPMSPREWTQLGHIITWGDAGGWGDEDLRYEPYDTDYSTARWAVRVRRERDATVVLPLQFNDYGSSGCSVSVIDTRGDAWDLANAVIMDTAKTREETGVARDREEITRQLRAEVDEMRQYIEGDVYGFVVEKDGETIESVWGFYGEEGLREAKSQAEGYAEDEARAESIVGFYALPH